MRTLLNRALEVCHQAEVYKREVYSTHIHLIKSDIQQIESEKKTEVSLRVIQSDKMGSAVGTSLEDESLIERAMDSMRHQTQEACIFPNETIGQVYAASEELSHMSTEDLVAYLVELDQRIQRLSPGLAFGIQCTKEIRSTHLINSMGFDDAYDYTNLALGLYTLNEQGFENAYKEYSGGKLPQIRDAELRQWIREHELDSRVVEVPTERMPVIFSGNAMGTLMMRLVSGVDGGNVTKGISPLQGKIGEKIFSDKISIRDDGGMPFGCNSFKFDDEGTRARNTVIVEKGVLQNYLLDLKQAQKFNQKATGNALKRTLFSKEIEDAPAIYESNLMVEGDFMPDEELIGQVKRGLLVTQVMGAHTGNIKQGDFSMNIASGFLIEEGKLVGKVKGNMIAGNIYELFKDIRGIGSQYEVMRSIFYVMGYSPMVLFGNVNVVG